MRRLIALVILTTTSIAWGMGFGGGNRARTSNVANEVTTAQRSTGHDIQMLEGIGNGTNKVTIRAKNSMAGDTDIEIGDGQIKVDGVAWGNYTGSTLPSQGTANGKYLKSVSGAAQWANPFDNFSASGTPTVPTPAANDDSTRVANTGWVRDQLASSPSVIEALGSDPANPAPGKAWVNSSTRRLMVASANGFYNYSGAYTAWDTTPDNFSFTAETAATTNTVYTSNSITVAGVNYTTPITCTGGEYEKNTSGTWTSTAGTVVSGDTVRTRLTSSANPSTLATATVTIGGVARDYNVTTAAGGASYLINEDFNAASAPSGWTVNGTVFGQTPAITGYPFL